MKGTRNLLIGVILGAMIGWALGFLRFPYLENNSSFLLGFIACVALILLILALLFLRKKHADLLRLIGGARVQQDSKTATRTYAIIWILVAAFIVAGGLLSSFLIQQQNKSFTTQMQKQHTEIQEQSQLMESVRRSSMVILLNDILDKVDDELKNNPGGKLSDKTIADIVQAFNYSFTTYRYWQGDSLSDKKLSPEKGQLLLALCRQHIDSSSFNKIKLSAHFSGADLKGRDLHAVDLSGADFTDADFTDADLSGTNLSGAFLRNANLWGAHANNARFTCADLRRAILSWAELNSAQLDSANMNGADLTSAQLRNADLHKATFRAAKLDGALLNEANLEGVSLIDASLKKANLTKANLTKADANRVNFNEAVMSETELNQLINVDKDWFEKLNQWHVIGAKEIQEIYKIEVYTVIEDVSWYRLEKN